MAVMGVVLERRAAPRAVTRRGREAAAAVGAELRVGFGPGAVGGTRGSRERGAERRGCAYGSAPGSPLPALRTKGSQGFRGVFGFQIIVVRVRELPRGAIELDLLQGAEGDCARREVVIGILSFIH